MYDIIFFVRPKMSRMCLFFVVQGGGAQGSSRSSSFRPATATSPRALQLCSMLRRSITMALWLRSSLHSPTPSTPSTSSAECFGVGVTLLLSPPTTSSPTSTTSSPPTTACTPSRTPSTTRCEGRPEERGGVCQEEEKEKNPVWCP